MSWFCTGKTNEELVNNLQGKSDGNSICQYSITKANIISVNGIIKSEKVAKVMKAVDRSNFTKKYENSQVDHSYEDSPQMIGYGVTISAPHMVTSNKKFYSIQKFIIEFLIGMHCCLMYG